MKKSYPIILLISLFVLLFNGCSGKIDYHIGFVTHSVTGRIIRVTPQPDYSSPFILVKPHIRTFMSTSEGDLHRIGAYIVKVSDNGQYTVELGDDVSQVDLYYFSEGYFMDSESFRRTLGIGRYEYNVDLKPDTGFKNSYYLAIKPILSDLMVEPRYKLPLSDQTFLKNWMDLMENRYR